MPDTVNAARVRAWTAYINGGGVVNLERQMYVLGAPPDDFFSLLPGVRYEGASSRGTIVTKPSANGFMFHWNGEADGQTGPATNMGVANVRLDYGDRPLDPSDIAIDLPFAAADRWPMLFCFHDLRIYGAFHAVKDRSGSFQGAYERLFLEKCSRGIEFELGTTRRLVNIHAMGSGDPSRDCFAYYLNGAKTIHMDCCSADDWRVTTLAAAPVVFQDLGGGRLTNFHAEHNIVNTAVCVTLAGQPPAADGHWGTGNMTHGGPGAALFGW